MDVEISMLDSDTVMFDLLVPETGWLGLGFGTSMEGGDIFVAMVDDND